MAVVPDIINPNRTSRRPFGLKSETILHRITLNPSSANPSETLYINIPKLAENMVIVPGSVYLVFDLNIAGHANNIFVDNVGRNLISSMKILFGGETVQDTSRYDLSPLKRYTPNEITM